MMTVRIVSFAVLASLLGQGAGVPSSPAVANDLDVAFNRLYNNDFGGSQRVLGLYTAARPDDPLGHAVRAAAYLYAEMSRLQLLGQQSLDERHHREGPKPQPDARVRGLFAASTAEAGRLAEAALAANPHDRNALLAFCLSAGAQRDYAALVDKRYRASLDHAKAAQSYALRLLRVDPDAHDAYFTTGFSEYLVGSMPGVLRWFVRLEDVQGSKARGIRNLEVAARTGHYLRPFAQMMLAMLYARESRLADSERMLESLTREFPENPTFRAELQRLSRRNGD